VKGLYQVLEKPASFRLGVVFKGAACASKESPILAFRRRKEKLIRAYHGLVRTSRVKRLHVGEDWGKSKRYGRQSNR